MNYRKAVLDKIITDLTALNHDGGSNDLFANVKKIYLEYPTSLPSAIVLNTGTAVEIIGNTSDNRVLDFEINVMELIENSSSQTEAELKIDRLGNIEDVVISYLEKLPNNLENDISGIHIVDLVINTAIYDYQNDERGIMLNLVIPFSVKIILVPQLL